MTIRDPKFVSLQKLIGSKLRPLIGKKQDGALEARSQRVVDELFKQLKARGQLVELHMVGLRIIGCRLGFDIGQIRVHHWLTEFTTDPFGTTEIEHPIIALGYVNGHQLYIKINKTDVASLIVRQARGSLFDAWNPVLQGVPPESSLHYVALERAKSLGYLNLLKAYQ